MSKELKFVINIVSNALFIFGIAALPSTFVAMHSGDDLSATVFLAICAVCIFGGIAARIFLRPKPSVVNAKLSYVTVMITWAVMVLISAVPFCLCGMHYSFYDALFESTAGWTTTGTSSIEFTSLPVQLQLWRATLNWLSGIGIIVLTLTILPEWRFAGRTMAAIEIPGTFKINNSSTLGKGYTLVLFTYIAITVVQFIMLLLAGMDPFNSVLTTLSNTSTGGLQHINNGLIVDLPTSIKVIITLFAFLGSLNSGVYIMLLSGKKLLATRNSELRAYVAALVSSTIILSGMILLTGNVTNVVQTLGDVAMQIVSFFSTAGYMVSDFDPWPTSCKIFLCIIMFIGACSFSTSGGIKISRVLVGYKTFRNSFFRYVHPNSVRAIRLNGKPLHNGEVLAMNSYIILFMMTFMFGALLLTIGDIDIYTSINLSQAMITNTGVSISELKDTAPLSSLSPYAKVVMSFIMLAGRLEIYPILMLFSRTFWREKSKA
jgi:trk system potassium uptake protein TrkH